MATSLEVRGEEYLYQSQRLLLADEIGGQTEDIGIVVLAGKFGKAVVPAECGTDTLMLVRRHADAVACGADGDPHVRLALFDGSRHGMGIVGVVATLGGVAAIVCHLCALLCEPSVHFLLEGIARVVGRKGDMQFT